jgi:hypothetical protein
MTNSAHFELNTKRAGARECRFQLRIASDAVLQDRDLVATIFRGNTGPATFAALACVCRTWRTVCHEDEDVIRAVAAFGGSMTKSVFTRVFCLSSTEADALPRTEHVRYRGGKYYLYEEAAVDQVLANDGMAARRKRISAVAALECSRYAPKPFLQEQWEEEDRHLTPPSTPKKRRQVPPATLPRPKYTTMAPHRRLDMYAIGALERLPYKVSGLYP